MSEPTEYADLHIHLLPGLDDGPPDMEASLALLRLGWEGGTRRFCATPHWNPPEIVWDPEDAARLAGELQRRAAAAGMGVEIRLGAEVALFPEILEEAARGALPTLGGSRYLLLETPPDVLPPRFTEFLFRVRSADRVPVLAHPERCVALWRDPERMREFVAAGALVQVTAGSLAGEAGRKARRTARRFLEEGWVHALASDGHGFPPRLCDLSVAEAEARAVLRDPGRARALVTESPLRLMGGPDGPARGGIGP